MIPDDIQKEWNEDLPVFKELLQKPFDKVRADQWVKVDENKFYRIYMTPDDFINNTFTVETLII